MRKISKEAAHSFISGGCFKRKNTEVRNNQFLLWGNKIAHINNIDGRLFLTCCGYDTVTTKDRLNTILRVMEFDQLGFYHSKGVFFFAGHEIKSTSIICMKGITEHYFEIGESYEQFY